ncbi:MAG: hypothetical protein JKY14_12520 [Paraglaciecola sp.]|nr:hypothetical protein [Paraglaciecola sp.]
MPDQMTKMFDGSANWTFSLYSLAYSSSYSEQDNRQVGRLNADFSRVNHSVSQNIQMFDSLSLNIDLGRARNFDHENNTVFYNNNAAVAVNYTLFGAWQMSLAASLNKDYDNFGLSTANAFSVNAGVDHQLSLQFSGVDISGQWYLRYAKQRSESADNVFAFNTFSQDWNMTSGLSLTF